jgi:hypothetical protein
LDLSSYSRATNNGYGGPRTPPQGARTNDLSGNVPANQVWAQAYNQGAQRYGGNTQAQSFTMPGSAETGVNPITGQPSSTAPNWDGNLAYSANRPAPITATATGINGEQMPWQDTLRQREAFAGNMINRLNQYQTGQMGGMPTFDTAALARQANQQLADGTFYNPFSAANRYDPDVQRAMDNATQYLTGTNFDNPFGNSPAANNPRPTFAQAEYNPNPPGMMPIDRALPPPSYGQPIDGGPVPLDVPRAQPYWERTPEQHQQYGDYGPPPPRPDFANPIPTPSLGQPYNPVAAAPSLPPVPQAPERFYDPLRRQFDFRDPVTKQPIPFVPTDPKAIAGMRSPMTPEQQRRAQGMPDNDYLNDPNEIAARQRLVAENDRKAAARAAEDQRKRDAGIDPFTGGQYLPPPPLNGILNVDYDPRTGKRLNNKTPAQLQEDRIRELEDRAYFDLRSQGVTDPKAYKANRDSWNTIRKQLTPDVDVRPWQRTHV